MKCHVLLFCIVFLASFNLSGQTLGNYEGSVSASNIQVGDVHVEKATVRYRMGLLFDEPVMQFELTYEAAAAINPSTVPVLVCEPGPVYLSHSVLIPDPHERDNLEVAGSPAWSNLFRVKPPGSGDVFLGADEAKALWKQGFTVTGLLLIVNSTNDALPGNTTPKPKHASVETTAAATLPSAPNPFLQSKPSPDRLVKSGNPFLIAAASSDNTDAAAEESQNPFAVARKVEQQQKEEAQKVAMAMKVAQQEALRIQEDIQRQEQKERQELAEAQRELEVAQVRATEAKAAAEAEERRVKEEQEAAESRREAFNFGAALLGQVVKEMGSQGMKVSPGLAGGAAAVDAIARANSPGYTEIQEQISAAEAKVEKLEKKSQKKYLVQPRDPALPEKLANWGRECMRNRGESPPAGVNVQQWSQCGVAMTYYDAYVRACASGKYSEEETMITYKVHKTHADIAMEWDRK